MEWVDGLINGFNGLFPQGNFFNSPLNVCALLAILLTGLACGSVGGLVVGNRMAFFSDALAHCAFAGVALGILFCLIAQVPQEQFRHWITPVMVGFGVVIGLLIAWVRDRTGLANDTVIGVFFAFAVGLGAVFMKLASQRIRVFNPESFLFGDPLLATPLDLLYLTCLLALCFAFLLRFYNEMILTSVSPSLALSRNIRVTLLRYLFVLLLGLLVNLCLQVAGILLINGLLIVPAAAAANLSRNLRQFFRWTIAITVAAGLGGQWLSWEISNRFDRTDLGITGPIVVLCCAAFFLSMILGRSRQ